MANNHSSVVYVEPNDVFSFSSGMSLDGKTHDKAPSLEDYCISMNIEVEVSSRENNTKVQGEKDVIVLAWKNENNKSTVNFMSGKKYSNGTRYLSTDWADMYTSDLIDHGTTEMLGIKSVNLEYNKTCIPVIDVQFTDVRGMSLFQPKGMSNDTYLKSVNGGKDIAQSFFECFFKFPYPIFTIYLKGYYGKPVAYEVMCDKFDTNFNASTGSFDVSVRFIGYWYSFLTDISHLALLASPFSDYGGKEYWEHEINGRFRIPNRDGSGDMPMPKMFEIWAEWRKLIASADEALLEDVVEAEVENHELEINNLVEIRKMAQAWYTSLEAVVQKKYGKERCIVLKNGGDYEGIIVLTTVDSPINMYDEFSQFPSDFIRLNGDLFSTIESYNSSDKSYSRIDNVSFDFSDYKKYKVLNYVTVDRWHGNELKFGGVNGECPVDRTKVAEAVNNYNSLRIIYNDGVKEYVDGYFINFDYSNITNRINSLIEDSKDNEENKKEAILKEQNRIMFSKMNWYPSIENFTKIVMAHLETFMYMMNNAAKSAKGRKLSDLKISKENLPDTKDDNPYVPPFPRVAKQVKCDNGTSKLEDVWVGEFNEGSGFTGEIDMVNGLFNAVDKIKKLMDENEKEVERAAEYARKTSTTKGVTMKYPLTSYDFYLSENPYGTKDDTKSDIAALMGKVCMRAFGLFSLNALRSELGDKWTDSATIKRLARLEAENFIEYIGELDKNVVDALGTNGCINADNAWNIVSGNSELAQKMGLVGSDGVFPWTFKDEEPPYQTLFTNLNGSSSFWLSKFAIDKTQNTFLYPIQRLSYDRLEREVNIFKDGKQDFSDGSFMTCGFGDNAIQMEKYLFGNYKSAYNDLYIDDDYTFVEQSVDKAASESEDDYKAIATLMGFGENNRTVGTDYLSLLRNVDLKNMDEMSKEIIEEHSDPRNFYTKYYDKSTYAKRDVRSKNGNEYEIYTNVKEDVLRSSVETNTFNDIGILRTYGSKKNEDNECYITDEEHDFFASVSLGTYKFPFFGGGGFAEKMNGKYIETAAFLFSLNKDKDISYKLLDDVTKNHKAFIKLPRLTLLQCGAALCVIYGNKNGDLSGVIDVRDVNKYLNCNDAHLMAFLNGMSSLGRFTVLNYFLKWADEWHDQIFNNLAYSITLSDNQNIDSAVFKFNNQDAYFTMLISAGYVTWSRFSICVGRLNGNNEFVRSLTNELLSCVSLTCGSVAHHSNLGYDFGYAKVEVSKIKVFLTEFFSKVREKFYVPSSRNEVVQTTDDPSNTTDDMKMEMYRYLKQVYDKWMPSFTDEDWKIESYFNEDNGECDGHTFKFIDSYYNKIGQKLLVNPSKVVEMIGNSLDNSDVNYMLFNFLADVYAHSKCMLMCIQNFIDMSDRDSMETIFKPLAYNSIGKPRKHPDFVVVYPYEPSKHLDVSNSDYEDDSFMLNNEMETPLAIRSRGVGEGDRWYKIPAFGVSYGRQYQSIFKNVNVSMANTVMTEQAILAKHAIIRDATNTNTKGVASQDLYSIYSNRSYTCKVEMMGCMWVQPMMYMVLLNIPMFRGSYMIMSVKHSMTPGNMTTEITAVRMANTSNKIVEDIFTDEFAKSATPKGIASQSGYYDKPRSECEYDVYPVFSTMEELEDEINRKVAREDCYSEKVYNALNGKTILEALSMIAANEGGTSVPLSYMLVATVLFNRRVRNGGYKDAIFREGQFNISGLTSSQNPPTPDVRDAVKNIFINTPTWILTKYNKTTVTPTTLTSDSNSKYFMVNQVLSGGSITEEKLSMLYYFGNYDEYTRKNSESAEVRSKPIILVQDAINGSTRYGHCYNGEYKDSNNDNISLSFWNSSMVRKNSYDAKEVNNSLFEAVQKSINSAPKLEVELSKRIDADGVMHITQSDGKTDHLAYVFDIILNTYQDYAENLYWVYSSSQQEEDPIEVCVKTKTDKRGTKSVWLATLDDAKNKIVDPSGLKFNNNDLFSPMFSYAVKKKYGVYMDSEYAKAEMKQFVYDTTTQFEGILKTDTSKCDAVSETSSSSENFNVSDSAISGEHFKVGGFDISKAVYWITKNSYDSYIKGYCGHCARYVLSALAAGGLTKPNGERHQTGEHSSTGWATNLWYDNLLTEWGFSMVVSGNVTANNRAFENQNALQMGDVAIIGFNHNLSRYSSDSYRYHACMWTGKEWISDYKQGRNMSPYTDAVKKTSEGYYPYAIFRYTKRG